MGENSTGWIACQYLLLCGTSFERGMCSNRVRQVWREMV
jgi:hypothetical protein